MSLRLLARAPLMYISLIFDGGRLAVDGGRPTADGLFYFCLVECNWG